MGGSSTSGMRSVLDVLDAVGDTVGPSLSDAIKLNATDQLEGGFDENDACKVVAALNRSGVDLIDTGGGMCIPGAKSTSDNTGKDPNFLGVAERVRNSTSKLLVMPTDVRGLICASQGYVVGREGSSTDTRCNTLRWP